MFDGVEVSPTRGNPGVPACPRDLVPDVSHDDACKGHFLSENKRRGQSYSRKDSFTDFLHTVAVKRRNE